MRAPLIEALAVQENRGNRVANYELDLLENATDSLNEALLKYEEGEAGEDKAYKFCILHFSHFLELLFKYYVYKAHPLLIYKNPFAKNLNEDSFTIGLPEAIQFLKNEGKEITNEFSKDLDWVKKIRNSIEHHKFSMNVDEVKETVGRLVKTVYEFNESHHAINLDEYLDADTYNSFHELAKSYEFKIKKAVEEADSAQKEAFRGVRPKEYMDVKFQRLECPECSQNTLISNDESSTGYQCTFCENDDSEEIEVDCGICGVPSAKYYMSNTEEWGYICDHHFK